MLAKFDQTRREVLIRPEIQQFNSLDSYKIDRIFEAVAPLKEYTKRVLDRLLK